MTINSEIINFEDYDNNQAIEDLLNSFEGSARDKAYKNLFNMSIIENKSLAAKFIYEQAQHNRISLDSIHAIKMAIKYSNSIIIELLLSKGIIKDYEESYTYELLKECIAHREHNIFYLLYQPENLDNNQKIELLKQSFYNHMFYLTASIAKQIDNIPVYLNKEELDMQLKRYSYDSYEFDTNSVNCILGLIELGGNPEPLNDCSTILRLITEKDFVNISKLLVAGIKIAPTKQMIDSFIKEENINFRHLESLIIELNHYLKKQLPTHNLTTQSLEKTFTQ